jgi:hypothetical protein
MFYKLLKLGIGGNFYNTIKSMYSSVNSCVKTRLGITPSFNIFQGVKQGEVLSPALFSMYVNDLPDALRPSVQNHVRLGSLDVDCLMYADDVVLLSQSKEGLQSLLNGLSTYCKKWKLEVNLAKTKVLIFNKNCRLLCDKFTLDDNSIECVNSYKYLGLDFASSGSFNLAVSNLKTRARKACFKLKTMIDPRNISPKTAMSLFNCLIKPIALYGSEVWGTSICGMNLQKTIVKFNEVQVERLHLSYAKYTLGVHKNATNAAVYGEIGTYPLAVSIIKSIFSYKNHILGIAKTSLLAEAWLECSNNTNTCTWKSTVSKLDGILGCENVPSIQDKITKTKMIYEKNWSEILQNKEGKLRTYATFKSNFLYENYLTVIKNADHRRALTKLRTSSHSLSIETGRYTSPKTPANQRFCKVCDSVDLVEDEYHFLLECSLYKEERKEMVQHVLKACNNFNNLHDRNKLIYLMTAEGDLICAIAQFCYEAFCARKSLLNPLE